MSTSHLDRKELKRPDIFLERAGSIMHFINENAKGFVALLIVLFLLGLGYAFYTNHNAKNAESAESALYDARKELASQLAKVKADPSGTPPQDWETTVKGGIEKVVTLANQYGGTRAAFEAYLLLGDIYFVRNQPAKAAQYFKQAVSEAQPRSSRPFAQYSLAFAYEDIKDYDKAIDLLRQIVASGEKTLRADTMVALGRNLVLKGDKPSALDAYNQVIKEFPNSGYSKTAEAQIANLR